MGRGPATAAEPQSYSITLEEFDKLRELVREYAGIRLSTSKVPMVLCRLTPRLRALALESFTDYYALIASPSGSQELHTAIDLLTVNETRFFREPAHFQLLETLVRARRSSTPFRVWSAACSSGEEPYSIAMVLADLLPPEQWEVVASDISLRMLERAGRALYPVSCAQDIPEECLRRHCLKGQGSFEGTLLIDPALRERVTFRHINLQAPLPALGQFDVVFLRNVMIYFDLETKCQLMARLLPLVRRGGHVFIGHAETLNGVTTGLTPVAPAVYRRD